MVTRLPNWQCREVEINEIGFLEYNSVIAGKDCWYQKETNTMIPYNYTNNYFINFIVEKEDNYSKEIIL